MKRLIGLFAILLAFAASSISAQDTRPYSEGTVSVITHVKILDGQYDNYMAYLSKTYKPLMEAQAKAGNIVRWAVYDARPRNKHDADVYLVVVYQNMASFDGMYERMSPIQREITGLTREQSNQASADRGSMREIIGSEMIREVVLK